MIISSNRARTSRAERAERRERQRAATAVPEELPPQLGHSLRELFATFAGVLHTRIALAGLELEEEIQRLLSAAVMTLIVLVAGFLGLVVGTFTIVMAVPPEYRVGTMIGLTVLYFVIAAVLAMRVKSIFELRPPIFGATFAELEKDKETLTQMVKAHRVAEAARDGVDGSSSEDAFAPPRARSQEI